MAKKTFPTNPSKKKSLLQMIKEDTGVLPTSTRDKSNDDKASDGYSWQRYTIVCDKELLGKIHGIASMEGVTIREIIEHCLRRGVASYEKKHGVIAIVKKDITEIM